MDKVNFCRKATDINDLIHKSENADKATSYIVEKVITLDKKVFDEFASDFFAFRDIITQNNELMRIDDKEIWHVIQVECSEVPYSILVECEGYDYARYTAVIFKDDKPTVHFDSSGETGNIFAVTNIARKALQKAGKKEECDKMWFSVQNSHSYEQALSIIREYVNLVDLGGKE